MNYIYNQLTKKQAKELMESLGEKKFRGTQLFHNIHGNGMTDLSEMTDLSKDLRRKLDEKGDISTGEIYKIYSSKIDATKKYLIKTSDRNIVETVYMEYENRNTLCVSTQIGCRMGCAFCASTKAGLVRNLKAYEILNQIYLVRKDIGKRISNLVLMGIGEPLDNMEELLSFLDIIGDEDGYNLSMRRITLSTCGIVPGIKELADREIPLNLTISLHNPFDDERRRIMPVAKRYSVDEIIEACDYFYEKTGRRVSYEYTLIENVNDTQRHSDKLVELFHDRNVHINLIGLNPIREYEEKSPPVPAMERFAERLRNRGVNTTIRMPQGADIEGACGQLRREQSEVIS